MAFKKIVSQKAIETKRTVTVTYKKNSSSANYLNWRKNVKAGQNVFFCLNYNTRKGTEDKLKIKIYMLFGLEAWI